MRIEPVEIYSDASNAAVLRHPGRAFPGVLVQGDTLYNFVQSLKQLQGESEGRSEHVEAGLELVLERLEDLLQHYKLVLAEHNIKMPFYEFPEA